MIHFYKNSVKKTTLKRTLAMFLAVALLCTGTFSVFAKASNDCTTKQEVVYINLNPDGTVENVYVVNIFELSEDSKIIDYGDYTHRRELKK